MCYYECKYPGCSRQFQLDIVESLLSFVMLMYILEVVVEAKRLRIINAFTNHSYVVNWRISIDWNSCEKFSSSSPIEGAFQNRTELEFCVQEVTILNFFLWQVTGEQWVHSLCLSINTCLLSHYGIEMNLTSRTACVCCLANADFSTSIKRYCFF